MGMPPRFTTVEPSVQVHGESPVDTQFTVEGLRGGLLAAMHRDMFTGRDVGMRVNLDSSNAAYNMGVDGGDDGFYERSRREGVQHEVPPAGASLAELYSWKRGDDLIQLDNLRASI